MTNYSLRLREGSRFIDIPQGPSNEAFAEAAKRALESAHQLWADSAGVGVQCIEVLDQDGRVRIGMPFRRSERSDLCEQLAIRYK